jgi:hypothetical protein
MTTDPQAASDEPRSVLAATRELTRQVRREQQSGWLPLLVFAVITFVAIPFDRYSGDHIAGHCFASRDGARACYSPGPVWYWVVAISLAYIAITAFYLHRSRRHGVGSPIRPYVIAGVILLALVTAWSLWTLADPSIVTRDLHVGSSPQADVFARIASPAGAIGLALILLAWIERSALLACITGAYLLAVLTAVGRHTIHSSPQAPPRVDPWGFLLHVLILSVILLIGSLAVALTQRNTRRGPHE